MHWTVTRLSCFFIELILVNYLFASSISVILYKVIFLNLSISFPIRHYLGQALYQLRSIATWKKRLISCYIFRVAFLQNSVVINYSGKPCVIPSPPPGISVKPNTCFKLLKRDILHRRVAVSRTSQPIAKHRLP